MTKQLNVRVPKITKQQIKDLQRWTGMTQTPEGNRKDQTMKHNRKPHPHNEPFEVTPEQEQETLAHLEDEDASHAAALAQIEQDDEEDAQIKAENGLRYLEECEARRRCARRSMDTARDAA